MNPLDRRPSEVAGQAVAQADGHATVIGSAPPKVLPGRSARQLLHLGSAAGGALFVAVAVAATVLEGNSAAILPMMALSLGGFAVVAAVFMRMKRRLYDELQHGYTSLCLQMGRAGGDRWRQQSVRGGNLVWDYDGTWLLNADGSIRRAPRPGAPEAPGFYPSPTGPGRLELWTGLSWAGRFRS